MESTYKQVHPGDDLKIFSPQNLQNWG